MPSPHSVLPISMNDQTLARQLKADGLVQSISSETIRCIFQNHKLKLWRSHLWLSAKVPHDEQFAKQVQEIVDLSTRILADWEMVLCVDEKSNLHPSPDASHATWISDALGARVQTSRSPPLVCRL